MCIKPVLCYSAHFILISYFMVWFVFYSLFIIVFDLDFVEYNYYDHFMEEYTICDMIAP
jgi:hypothetical protein